MLSFNRMGRDHRLVISIDFPALTELVNYLISGQQQKIDALTSTVSALTQKLEQSSTSLGAEVTKEQS